MNLFKTTALALILGVTGLSYSATQEEFSEGPSSSYVRKTREALDDDLTAIVQMGGAAKRKLQAIQSYLDKNAEHYSYDIENRNALTLAIGMKNTKAVLEGLHITPKFQSFYEETPNADDQAGFSTTSQTYEPAPDADDRAGFSTTSQTYEPAPDADDQAKFGSAAHHKRDKTTADDDLTDASSSRAEHAEEPENPTDHDEAELATLRQNLQEAQDSLQATRDALDLANQDLLQKNQTIDGLKADLESSEARIDEAKRSANTARATLQQREAELNNAQEAEGIARGLVQQMEKQLKEKDQQLAEMDEQAQKFSGKILKQTTILAQVKGILARSWRKEYRDQNLSNLRNLFRDQPAPDQAEE